MWLLNTSTAEQKFFPGPEDVPGGYAILSHVWDEEEDNFQSVREAVKEAKGEAPLKKEVEALKTQVAELVKAAKEAKATANAKEKAEEQAKIQGVPG